MLYKLFTLANRFDLHGFEKRGNLKTKKGGQEPEFFKLTFLQQ